MTTEFSLPFADKKYCRHLVYSWLWLVATVMWSSKVDAFVWTTIPFDGQLGVMVQNRVWINRNFGFGKDFSSNDLAATGDTCRLRARA